MSSENFIKCDDLSMIKPVLRVTFINIIFGE